jgi:hypothetical protein
VLGDHVDADRQADIDGAVDLAQYVTQRPAETAAQLQAGHATTGEPVGEGRGDEVAARGAEVSHLVEVGHR